MNDKTQPYDIPPALLRQRRNLLIVSLITLFMVSAGAELNTISLLGVQISFDNPNAVFWFLQIFLFYFLYRYYLYIIQEPDLLLKESFYNRLRTLTWQKIQKIKNELYPDVKEYGGEYDFYKMEKTSFFMRKVKGVVGKSENGRVVNGEFDLDISMFFLDAIKAATYVAFNRSYVTDYLLPFAIAFTAIISGWGYDGK